MSIDWIDGTSYSWVLLTEILTPRMLAGLMSLHCIIGITAAIAAQRQGRPFGPWIFWGLLGGSVALMAVFLRPPTSKPSSLKLPR